MGRSVDSASILWGVCFEPRVSIPVETDEQTTCVQWVMGSATLTFKMWTWYYTQSYRITGPSVYVWIGCRLTMWYLMLFPDTLTRRRFKSTYTFLTVFCFNSLSIFFFACFFFYYYRSIFLHLTNTFCQKRLCLIGPCIWWVHFPRSVLFCQPHQQLFTDSMKEIFKHSVYCMQICATIWDSTTVLYYDSESMEFSVPQCCNYVSQCGLAVWH